MPTFLLIKGSWNNVLERIEGADESGLKKMFAKAKTMKA
jgi:hypothetical protein